jgi:hypothetical protein
MWGKGMKRNMTLRCTVFNNYDYKWVMAINGNEQKGNGIGRSSDENCIIRLMNT